MDVLALANLYQLEEMGKIANKPLAPTQQVSRQKLDGTEYTRMREFLMAAREVCFAGTADSLLVALYQRRIGNSTAPQRVRQ